MSANKKYFEYTNHRNGCKERVWRDGDSYYINSDWGRGFFPENKRRVSRAQMADCMKYTGAPEYVTSEILGNQ